MYLYLPSWSAPPPPSSYLPSIDVSGLSGYIVEGFVHTHRHGKAPVGGSFQLKFRGYGPTPPISTTATAFDVRDALTELLTIDTVEVRVSAFGCTFPM